jgi:hypothetical protein
MMFLIFYYKNGAEMLLSFDVKFKQNKCCAENGVQCLVLMPLAEAAKMG